MQKGLFLPLLLLTACSTSMENTETARPAPGLLAADNLSPRAPQAEDVLYANILLQDGKWQLRSIGSQRKPVDLLKGEERLYIRTGKRVAMPDYDYHKYRDEAKGLFDCSQDLGYNKLTTYNPCTSQLSSNTRFGEGWFGWTRRLDIDEINKAVQQTDLFSRAEKEMALVTRERQRCNKLRRQAETLAAKQQVALRVIDETGMYRQGYEHVKYDLQVEPEVAKEGCEQELAAVKMRYELGIEQEFNLVLAMRGKSDWSKLENDKLTLERSIAEADKRLVPTLYITGKKVEHYNLYRTWSNAEVEIEWRTLDINSTDIRQVFDIRNLANTDIEIQGVTFHINGHRVYYRNHIQLPSHKGVTGLEHASRYFVLDKKHRQEIESIRVIDTQDERATFGVTVKYKLAGRDKTLSLSNNVQLSQIL